MTQLDFVALVANDPALRAVPVDRAELMAYVASMWPWCQDDPRQGPRPSSRHREHHPA